MVDWLTFRMYVKPHDPLKFGGLVQKISSDGEVEWTTTTRMKMVGSFESAIYVRSLDSRTIEISGNPAKYFQGHNLWGSADVEGLTWALMEEVALKHSGNIVPISPDALTRVDLTQMLDLKSPENVNAVLRDLEHTAHMKNKGRAVSDHGTLYWSKNSRRWALKAYEKHSEVKKHHKDNDSIAAVAFGKLRLELVLRGMELRDRALHLPHAWRDVDPMLTLREFLDRLELPESKQSFDLSSLPGKLRGVFYSWAQGDDPLTVYPRRTAYRYRNAMLEYGIDIFVPPAERIQHVKDMDLQFGWKWPDIRKVQPWEPSPEDLERLPTFVPKSRLERCHA